MRKLFRSELPFGPEALRKHLGKTTSAVSLVMGTHKDFAGKMYMLGYIRSTGGTTAREGKTKWRGVYGFSGSARL